jgi:hypothetical protein
MGHTNGSKNMHNGSDCAEETGIFSSGPRRKQKVGKHIDKQQEEIVQEVFEEVQEEEIEVSSNEVYLSYDQEFELGYYALEEEEEKEEVSVVFVPLPINLPSNMKVSGKGVSSCVSVKGMVIKGDETENEKDENQNEKKNETEVKQVLTKEISEKQEKGILKEIDEEERKILDAGLKNLKEGIVYDNNFKRKSIKGLKQKKTPEQLEAIKKQQEDVKRRMEMLASGELKIEKKLSFKERKEKEKLEKRMKMQVSKVEKEEKEEKTEKQEKSIDDKIALAVKKAIKEATVKFEKKAAMLKKQGKSDDEIEQEKEKTLNAVADKTAEKAKKKFAEKSEKVIEKVVEKVIEKTEEKTEKTEEKTEEKVVEKLERFEDYSDLPVLISRRALPLGDDEIREVPVLSWEELFEVEEKKVIEQTKSNNMYDLLENASFETITKKKKNKSVKFSEKIETLEKTVDVESLVKMNEKVKIVSAKEKKVQERKIVEGGEILKKKDVESVDISSIKNILSSLRVEVTEILTDKKGNFIGEKVVDVEKYEVESVGSGIEVANVVVEEPLVVKQKKIRNRTRKEKTVIEPCFTFTKPVFQDTNEKRTKAFEDLANVDTMVSEATCTKPCTFMKNGVCRVPGCKYAHTDKEFKPRECKFADSCKFFTKFCKSCKFMHPTETRESYKKRQNISFPDDLVQPVEKKRTLVEKIVSIDKIAFKSKWGESNLIESLAAAKTVEMREKVEKVASKILETIQKEQVVIQEQKKVFETVEIRKEACEKLKDMKGQQKSQLCRNVLTHGKCTRQVCMFAHSIEELNPQPCLFKHACKIFSGERAGFCKCIHPTETKDSFIKRIGLDKVSIPSSTCAQTPAQTLAQTPAQKPIEKPVEKKSRWDIKPVAPIVEKPVAPIVAPIVEKPVAPIVEKPVAPIVVPIVAPIVEKSEIKEVEMEIETQQEVTVQAYPAHSYTSYPSYPSYQEYQQQQQQAYYYQQQQQQAYYYQQQQQQAYYYQQQQQQQQQAYYYQQQQQQQVYNYPTYSYYTM